MPNCNLCNKNVPRRTNINYQMLCANCAREFQKRRANLLHAKNKLNELNRMRHQRHAELVRKKRQILEKRNKPLKNQIRFPPVPTHVPRNQIRFPPVPTHVPRNQIRFPPVPTHVPKVVRLPKFPQVPTHTPRLNKR